MPTSSSLRVAHTERDVFAELHGFFVADPVLLDELHERRSRDLDLLRLYSETEAGDRSRSIAEPR